MTTWKPGDVVDAYVPSRGRRHTLLRVSPHVHDDGEWPWLVLDDDAANGDLLDQGIGSMNVRDARLLFSSTTGSVVLDPESAEDVARLADAFCHARWSHIEGSDECDPLTRSSMQAALREFAAPTPPKPAEPTGLGAVVETETGRRYVRTYGAAGQPDYECWKADVLTSRCRWSEIPQPVRVLSEGIQ